VYAAAAMAAFPDDEITACRTPLATRDEQR
jgi:hypothetical protein